MGPKASENQRTGQKRKHSVEEMVSKVRDRILPTLPVEPLRNTGSRYTVCGLSRVNQSYVLAEVGNLNADSNQFDVPHLADFSTDGASLVACGFGHHKAFLWDTESLRKKCTTCDGSRDAHNITDIRFSPIISSRLATSSSDKTVRVWNQNNPFPIFTFKEHTSPVLSVDFHPTIQNKLCSNSINNELIFWNMKKDTKAKKYGCFDSIEQCENFPTEKSPCQVRFKPPEGSLLAVAHYSDHNAVTLFDVQMQCIREKLQGHHSFVTSISWQPSGELLVTVSRELVKVWHISLSGIPDPVHKFKKTLNQGDFHTAIFHPTDSSLLIIGCGKTLQIWDTNNWKLLTTLVEGHESSVSCLASSSSSGLIASASIDGCVKLWRSRREQGLAAV